MRFFQTSASDLSIHLFLVEHLTSPEIDWSACCNQGIFRDLMFLAAMQRELVEIFKNPRKPTNTKNSRNVWGTL
jgi:hypothetical protein